MKFKKSIYTIIVITLLSTNVFSQDGITVALSMTTVHGYASTDYGIDFALRSLETDIIYQSKPLNRLMSRHSVVSNLPAGKYEMIYLGSHEYEYAHPDSSVLNFFGVLVLTKSEGYYLGDFRCKIPVGLDMPKYLNVITGVVPQRLTKVLRRRDYIAKGQELFSYQQYLSDNFVQY